MGTKQIEAINQMFDDHPSLCASLEDFEHDENPSPVLNLPSQHSGFKSSDSEADMESNSEEPWSPPPTAWARQSTGDKWYRHQPYLESARSRSSASPEKSREMSPDYESAQEDEGDGDYTLAANIPLPRDSLSPVKEEPPAPPSNPGQRPPFAQDFGQPEVSPTGSENPDNCALSWLCPSKLID